MISERILFKNEFIPIATWYQSKIIRNESFLSEFIEVFFPEPNTYSGDFLYLYNVSAVRHSYLYESSLEARDA